jgi:hypothetical protein
MTLRTVSRAAASALCLLALGGAVSGCALLQGRETGGGSLELEAGKEAGEEAFREGLFEELNGLSYKVLITRQLNRSDPEDRGYVVGPEAPPGQIQYGVFLQVCNMGEETLRASRSLTMVDTLGNEFEPVELPETNIFAYRPAPVRPGGCIPDEASVAAQSPTGGALVLYQIPLETIENRPLEMEVQDGYDAEGQPRAITFELDI